LPTPTPTPSPTSAPTPTSAPGGANNYDCFTHLESCGAGTTTQNSSEQGSDPVVAAVGAALLVQLGILDTLLGIGIIAVAVTAVTVPGAQLGLVGELVLIPIEAISLNVTLVAAEMAVTGSTNIDPLPLLHLVNPNILPYNQ